MYSLSYLGIRSFHFTLFPSSLALMLLPMVQVLLTTVPVLPWVLEDRRVFVLPLLNGRRETAPWPGLCRERQEPAGWPQAVGGLARPLLHISPLPPPLLQPPSASTGRCTTPAARDASRPATTGTRSARAISRAWQAATVQPTWSFTGGGASSQSFVLSGDPRSAA